MHNTVLMSPQDCTKLHGFETAYSTGRLEDFLVLLSQKPLATISNFPGGFWSLETLNWLGPVQDVCIVSSNT